MTYKRFENSTAKLIFEHIINHPDGWSFTHGSLTKDMASVISSRGHSDKRGVVSGFLNRAMKKGLITAYKLPEGHRLYKLVDRSITWEFKKSSKGSEPGREINGRKQTKLPLLDSSELEKTKLSLSQRLLDFAWEVEQLENKSLSNYSIEELFDEVKRRMK